MINEQNNVTSTDIVRLFSDTTRNTYKELYLMIRNKVNLNGEPLTWNSIISDGEEQLGYTPIGLAVKYGRDGTFEKLAKLRDGVDISKGELGESYTLSLILKPPAENLDEQDRVKYLARQKKYLNILDKSYSDKGLLLHAFLKFDQYGRPAVEYIEEQLGRKLTEVEFLTESGIWSKFGETILRYQEESLVHGFSIEFLQLFQDYCFTKHRLVFPEEVIEERITLLDQLDGNIQIMGDVVVDAV